MSMRACNPLWCVSTWLWLRLWLRLRLRLWPSAAPFLALWALLLLPV